MIDLTQVIRNIPDFPKPGIQFKDITSLLQHPKAFQQSVDQMVAHCEGRGIDVVAGIESRGFIFGAPLALALGVSFIPVRKPGKLPGETIKEEYELEYGIDALEIHKDALKPGDKVAIVDDLLATGGTMLATCKLIERLQAKVETIATVIELVGLPGRATIQGYDYFTLTEIEVDE